MTRVRKPKTSSIPTTYIQEHEVCVVEVASVEHPASSGSGGGMEGSQPQAESSRPDTATMAAKIEKFTSCYSQYRVFPESFESLASIDYKSYRLYRNMGSAVSDLPLFMVQLGHLFRGVNGIGIDRVVTELFIASLYWLSVGGCKRLDIHMIDDIDKLIKIGYSPSHLIMCLLTPCPEALRTKEWKPQFEYMVARAAVRLDLLDEAVNTK